MSEKLDAMGEKLDAKKKKLEALKLEDKMQVKTGTPKEETQVEVKTDGAE